MPLALERLLRVPHVDSSYGFDISPDGARVAVSWNGAGTWEIYESSLGRRQAIGPDSFGRRITDSPGGKFHPRYSPDGSRLAYALDPDGSESFHIAVFDFAAGRSTDLTPGIHFAHQPNMSWSPDGRRLAVLSDAGGQFALHVLPADGGPARLLFNPGHPCWDAHWSPAGDWLAVEVEWHHQDRSIFLVNAANGEAVQLVQDGLVLNAMHPAWSPDGRSLAFCADPTGWYRIGLYDLATRAVRWLDAKGDGDDTDAAWSPDGSHVASVRTLGADTALRVHDLSGATVAWYSLGPGIHAHPSFSRDGSRLLFLFENPRHPADLWQLELAGSQFLQLTNSLPDDVDTSGFAIPEEVWYPSTDGAMVPAILYRPNSVHAPALINIHGGPNWLYQFNWHPLMSYLVAQGWAVLAPNYRGSTGYGRFWAQANHMRLGEVDTSDCAAGARYLIRERLADARRILITGRSHGGYLTMTCMTEYPALWAGGSAVVPFMNWFTGHETAREDLQHWDLENLGDPVENAALWRRRSPFFYLHQVQAGVQFVCGGNDPRCPASESLAARDRLRELGKEVELVLYPDEGHGFLKLENVIDHEMQRLAFLERMAVPHAG